MKYVWTEDTGAGLHFWKLVNQLFFDDALVVESKGSNQGLLNALSDIDMKENHRINLSKIGDEKTLQYLASFKRYSTERVMKSLVGEFTQNEKWFVKGGRMGECWYKDCCVSEHPDNLRCGKPKIEDGNEKMRMLIQSEEVQKIIGEVII